MHLEESADDLAGLIAAGDLDSVQKTVRELHLDGLCQRQLNRALAAAGALEVMYYRIAELELSRRQGENELRRLLVWRHWVTKLGLRWVFTRHIRTKRASLHRLSSDLKFMMNWTSGVVQYAKTKGNSAPQPGAVCLLREAARASRRGQRQRCEELRQRAIARYGKEEVDYVDEAYRLSYAERLRREQPRRMRASFAQ